MFSISIYMYSALTLFDLLCIGILHLNQIYLQFHNIWIHFIAKYLLLNSLLLLDATPPQLFPLLEMCLSWRSERRGWCSSGADQRQPFINSDVFLIWILSFARWRRWRRRQRSRSRRTRWWGWTAEEEGRLCESFISTSLFYLIHFCF